MINRRSSPPPFKENELFRSDFDASNGNACVGMNGGPYDHFAYAQGYLEASGAILTAAFRMQTPIDVAIYPACLTFRHGLELILKYVVSELREVIGDEVLPKHRRRRPNHSLIEYFDAARESLHRACVRISDDDLPFIEKVVACFTEIDPGGTVFRYPHDLKENPHLQEWSLINGYVIEKYRSKTLEIGKRWDMLIDDRIEDFRYDGS